jgi:hypothetical protein
MAASPSAPVAEHHCSTRYRQVVQARYIHRVYRRPKISAPARRLMTRMIRCARSDAAAENMRAVQRLAGRARVRRRSITPFDGPGGPWAIPWPIVRCESRGQNLAPNSATASGYYQFLTSTFEAMGGHGPAYLAPREEQDRLASKLWAGGRNASQWDCAAIVGWGR